MPSDKSDYSANQGIDVKSDFEEVTSIHIYSLQPHRPKVLAYFNAHGQAYSQPVGFATTCSN